MYNTRLTTDETFVAAGQKPAGQLIFDSVRR